VPFTSSRFSAGLNRLIALFGLIYLLFHRQTRKTLRLRESVRKGYSSLDSDTGVTPRLTHSLFHEKIGDESVNKFAGRFVHCS
jgi:hypothetical protein